MSPELVANIAITRSDGAGELAFSADMLGVALGPCHIWIKNSPAMAFPGATVELDWITTFQRTRAGLPPMAPHEIVPIAPGGTRVFALCVVPNLANETLDAIFYDLDAPMPGGTYETFPPIPDGVAVVGAVKVRNESANDFVPGVTDLESEGLRIFFYNFVAPVEGKIADPVPIF